MIDKNGLNIYKATKDDFEAIVKFNQLAAVEIVGRELDPDDLKAGIEYILKLSTDFYLVVKYKGKYVGQIMVHQQVYDWYNKKFWWLEHLYVVKEMRGNQLPLIILKHLISMAEKDGYVKNIILHVEGNKNKLIQLYKRRGFEMHANKVMIRRV